MKHYTWTLGLSAVVLLASFAMAQATNGNGNDKSGPITLGAATRGVVFYTAAVNSDGTLASCFGCVSAVRLGVGQYQVVFKENVQANNGWSRWCQPDTLNIGTTNAYCATADRLGNSNGVWLNFQGPNGPVDTNFFLFVAR
jgi:hypothetical protein